MITSKTNDTFKMLKSLLTSKGIKKEQYCLISGKKIVAELEGKSVFHDESADISLSKELFKELDVHGTHSPLLLTKTPQIETWDEDETPSGIEVLIPAGDPKNLGALIRTSQAFSASKIILLKEAAHPFLPESIKSSSGAVFSTALFQGPSIKELQESDQLFVLDGGGTPLENFKQKNIRLLIGEEGGNIPASLLKNSLSIQISEQVESLNVNAALAVALFSLNQV